MKLEIIIKERTSVEYSTDVQPTIRKIDNIVYVPLYVTNERDVYYYNNFSIVANKYNYNDLVDLFIKMVYSDKEMFAIINNYLLDNTDAKVVAEFNEMQAIRKEAKELAKEILEMYPANSLNGL